MSTMLMDRVNLQQIRVFLAVLKNLSMTQAARELHLTQPGVSQHILILEDALGFKLFDRVGRRLLPTEDCQKLGVECERLLSGLDGVFEGLQRKVTGGVKKIEGKVNIGMPIEFGVNFILPQVARFGIEEEGVDFTLHLGFASEMNRRLLDGELDFAFVDEFKMDPAIQKREVYTETFELCVAGTRLTGAPKNERRFYEALDYVDYQREAPVVRKWFSHHLGTKQIHLKVRAIVMDVQGLVKLITGGLGAGVLPGYLVAQLKAEGVDIKVLRGTGVPLQNTISLATLKGKTQSPAVRACMERILERIKKRREP